MTKKITFLNKFVTKNMNKITLKTPNFSPKTIINNFEKKNSLNVLDIQDSMCYIFKILTTNKNCMFNRLLNC